MAEETINEVIERVQARVANSQQYDNRMSVHKDDALALIAELEALRKERDELRDTLKHVLEIAYNGRGFTTVAAKNAAFGAIKDVISLANAALSQPAPAASEAQEWTPQSEYDPRQPVFDIGQEVRETINSERTGVVTGIRYNEKSGIPRYITNIDPLYAYSRGELVARWIDEE